MRRAVTRFTKSGAASGMVRMVDRSLVAASGTSTRRSSARERSMAAKLRSTMVRPRSP
jgi:hypothetical protein